MKKILSIVILLIAFSGFAQNVSDYEYVIVPSKFSFFKEANKYNLNALTKSVFEQQGFEVYYDNDIFPQELAQNRCNALYADMIESNSIFVTKIKLELKDCKNQLVYTSNEGKSSEKDYAKAYVQAFREVGKSIGKLKSGPKQQVTEPNVIAVTQVITPVPSSMLFAQPIANGFQLVDSTPKVVMKLFKSSMPNFYIAQKENLQGVVFNKNSQWFFEYYQNDKLVSESMEIKF